MKQTFKQTVTKRILELDELITKYDSIYARADNQEKALHYRALVSGLISVRNINDELLHAANKNEVFMAINGTYGKLQ